MASVELLALSPYTPLKLPVRTCSAGLSASAAGTARNLTGRQRCRVLPTKLVGRHQMGRRCTLDASVRDIRVGLTMSYNGIASRVVDLLW